MAADYVVVERGVLERLIDTAVSYAMQTYDRSGVTGRLCDEARAALSAEAVQGHCACGGSGTIRIYEIVNGQPSIAETKPCPGIPTAPAGAEPCRRCAVLLDKPEDRLYHAADRTWWKWEVLCGKGRLVSSDAPAAQPDVAGWLRERAEEMVRRMHTSHEDFRAAGLREAADAWEAAHPQEPGR